MKKIMQSALVVALLILVAKCGADHVYNSLEFIKELCYWQVVNH
jgi:hypothetical protein